MAVNKVEINGEVKLDLTQDTVTENTLLKGVTAHDAAGNSVEGKVVTTPVPKTSNLLKGDGAGGIGAAVPGTDYLTEAPVTSVNSKTGAVKLAASDVGAVSKTGDTMTGNLTVGSASLQTNGYVTGTWLKTTANISLGSASSKIAVINDGWIYSRTTAQIKSDIGLGNVDNVKQYSASNPPPYPVTSVNGHIGAVTVHEVPAVTTADNGKFLRVVNGEWAAVEIANANGGSF